MAVELHSYDNLQLLERKQFAEAVRGGLESMQTLLNLLAFQEADAQIPLRRDCSVLANATIAKFKTAVSLLSRPGHARFRRASAKQQHRAASLAAHLTESSLVDTLPCCSSSETNCLNSSSRSSSQAFHACSGLRPSISNCTHPTLTCLQQESMNLQSASDVVHMSITPKAIFRSSGSRAHIDHNSGKKLSSSTPATPHVALSSPQQDQAVPLHALQISSAMSFAPQDISAESWRWHGMALTQEALYSNGRYSQNEHSFTCTPPPSATMGSFLSSLSVDGSVANEKNFIPQLAIGGGRPPMSRKCPRHEADERDGKCNSPGKCHCPKRRKFRNRRVVKVPSISLKAAEIPTDEFSWRKYGQKPIKGSPHPRAYYKCSTARGCPARKHVERAVDEANMLVVTYDGDHNHSTEPTENT